MQAVSATWCALPFFAGVRSISAVLIISAYDSAHVSNRSSSKPFVGHADRPMPRYRRMRRCRRVHSTVTMCMVYTPSGLYAYDCFEHSNASTMRDVEAYVAGVLTQRCCFSCFTFTTFMHTMFEVLRNNFYPRGRTKTTPPECHGCKGAELRSLPGACQTLKAHPVTSHHQRFSTSPQPRRKTHRKTTRYFPTLHRH